MNWLKGFSTCSELGVDGCVIWWDAWAAIGTVFAVFVAIAGPSIQRRFFLRKKANAVFASAFKSDVVKARIAAERLIVDFPLSVESEQSIANVKNLMNSSEWRSAFEQRTAKLAILGSRDLDGSKWPAVDLDLILAVADGIQGASDVMYVGEVMTTGHTEQRDWSMMLPMFHDQIQTATEHIKFAERCLERASLKLLKRKELKKPNGGK